jgi:hypothetical protein
VTSSSGCCCADLDEADRPCLDCGMPPATIPAPPPSGVQPGASGYGPQVGPLRTTRELLEQLDDVERLYVERWIWELGGNRPCVVPLPSGRFAVRTAGQWWITPTAPVVTLDGAA